jgi:hypothetical protein
MKKITIEHPDRILTVSVKGLKKNHQRHLKMETSILNAYWCSI